MSGGGRGVRVACFGVRVDIVSGSDDVAEALHRYVLPWAPRGEPDGTPADCVVEVRRAADGEALAVMIDGASALTVPGPLAAVAPVQRAVDDAIVRGQAALAMVHAGVVAHGGRAILLPGPSGAGKSSLVAELVRGGAPYLSDEYALIDAAGRVHPYPRPLLLRDASGAAHPVLPADVGGHAAAGPLPAGLVLGLRYRAGAPLSIEPMSQAEGVLLLLRNTPHVLADQPWILRPLERAAGAAACYAGERGEAPAAAKALIALAAALADEQGGGTRSGSGRRSRAAAPCPEG